MIDVGQQLGGYTILERIGRGGMGDVFLAQHRRVARKAAVKVLVPELSQKAAVLERFFNEARGTSLIKHPGIVEILDCDVLDGQAFIIMEFLEGENLGSYLHRTGPLAQDLPFLLGVGTAVAGAVGAAHAIPIIHRDLKPDNVYLHLPAAHDASVTVKILDFGIAKLAQTDGGPSQTSTGMLLGTPAYMSPEQCRGAGRVDARSDVYSLGCILYEAVCGWPPFVREGMGDLIVAHVSEVPDPPLAHNRDVPEPLNALIMRMLAKRPEERPQTMDDVAAELAACAQRLGVAVNERLRPNTPVRRPSASPDISGPTQRPVTPVGAAGGTMPLVPRQASGPVSGSSTSRPTAPLSPVPSQLPAGESLAVSGRVRAGEGHDGDFAASQPVTGAGGTRVLEPTRTSTTFSGAASEIDKPAGTGTAGTAASRPRGAGKIVAGGAVVLAGAIAIILATRPKPEAPGQPVPGAAAPPTAVVETPPPSAPVAQPRKPEPEPPPTPTVRIDIQGVPARTALTVDGNAATMPVELPRGSGVHRIVLRPPGGGEKVLEVDGSRDRLIELVFEAPVERSAGRAERADKSERADKAAEKGASRRASGATRERGEKKPAPGATDREAITDI